MKRIKRLQLFWDLRKINKMPKRGSYRRYIYTKRPRSKIFKKKILIRKLISYYYCFPYNKKVRSLVIFSSKEKNKVTVDSSLNLMGTFESHLSVFVFRCKLVSSILDSKSLITSGGVLVNGVVTYYPNYILNNSDIVQLCEKNMKKYFNKFIRVSKPPR
jgi:ribosomal protein S4